MFVPLLLAVTLAAAPPVKVIEYRDIVSLLGITDGTSASLAADSALPERCARLGLTDIVISMEEQPLSALTNVADAVSRCGTRRLGIATDNGEPLWFELGPPRGYLFVIDAAGAWKVLAGGATATFSGNATRIAKAFTGLHSATFAVAQDVRVRELVRLASLVKTNLHGAPEPRLTLLTPHSYAALDATQRALLTKLGFTGIPDADVSAISAAPNAAATALATWFLDASALRTEEIRVPRWTRASSMLCRAPEGPVVLGVGVVQGIRNLPLARATADNRARAEIAKLTNLSVHIDKGRVSTFVSAILTGVTIVEHFTAEDGVTMSLAHVTAPPELAPSAVSPCPSGEETIRSVDLAPIDPQGGWGSQQRAWWDARAGLENEKLFVVLPVGATLPYGEARRLATDAVRLEFGRALVQAIARLGTRPDSAFDCLAAISWLAAVSDAPVETVWDAEKQQLLARATLTEGDLRGALPRGCPDDTIQKLGGTLQTMYSFEQPVDNSPAAPLTVETPVWVQNGSGLYNTEGARIFYGVGAVTGIKNQALARTTADNRARAEIAKQFEVYSASIMKNYVQLAVAQSSEEQHISQVIMTFSAVTLSGVQIVDHWVDPRDNTWWALAQLNIEDFTGNIDKMKELNQKPRDYAKQNAARIFDELQRK